ncbi:hypothetical protein FOZ60_007628 [Perkinsus olseni]|nr:hypothetical protein FOZ60_007628 [Perkinsus olseni]
MTAGIEIDEDADFEDLLVEQDEELQVSIVALLQGAWEATGDMSFNVRELNVEYEGDSGIRLRIYRAHRRGNLGRAEFLLNDVWLMVKEETSFLPPQYITWQRIDQQDLYLPEVMCWMRPVACAEEQQHALSSQEDPSAQPRSTSADNINVAEVTLHIHSILDHVLVQCGLALELEKMEGVSMSVRRVDEDSLRANLWRAQPLVRRMDVNNHLVRKLGPLMSGSFKFASGSMNLLEAFVTLFQPPLVRATRPVGELNRSRASTGSDGDELENLMPFKLLRLLVEPVANTDIFTCTPIGAVLQTGRGLPSTEIRNFKRGPRRVRSSFDAAFASELVDKKKFLTATVGSAKVDPLKFMSVGGPLEVSQPAGRPSESPRKSVYRTGVKRLTFGRVSHHLEVCLLSTLFADDIVEQNCGLLLACSDDEVGANKGNDVLRRLVHFRLQRMEEESSAGRALHIGVFQDGNFAGVISIGTERTQKGVLEDKFVVRLADAIAGPGDLSKCKALYLGLSVPSLTHSWLALRAGRKKKISEDLEKFESDLRIEEETNTALAIEFAKLQQDMVETETSKDARENAAAPAAVFERRNSCDEDGTARGITAGDLRGRSTQELQCLKQAWSHRMESRTFTQQADALEEAASEGARMMKTTRAKLKRIREECSDREMIAKLAKDAATAAKRKGDPSYGALKQAKRERTTEFEGCERAKEETLEANREKEAEESKASMEQARSRAKKHIECAVACEKSGDHAIGRVQVEQQLRGVSAELEEVLGRLRGLEEERADLQEEINVKEQLLDRLSAEISSVPPTSRIRSVHQAKIRLNRQEVSDARQKLDVIDGKVKVEQKQQEKLKKEMNELKDTLELIEKFSHRRKFKDRLEIVDRLNRSTASLKDLNKEVGGAKAELEMIDDMAAESKELLELVEETRAKAEIFMLYPASDRAYCASIGESRGRESCVTARPIKRSRSIERWCLEDEWCRLEIPLTLRREGLECASPREVDSIGVPESLKVVIFYSPWNRECMRRRDDMVTAGKELQGLPVCGTEELRVVFVNVEYAVDSDIPSLEEADRFIHENHLEGRLLPVVKLHRGSEIFFYEGTLSPLASVKDWIVDNCSAGGGPREVSSSTPNGDRRTEQIPTGASRAAMKSQLIYSLPFMTSDARVGENRRTSLVDVRDNSVTRRMGQSGGVTVAMWLKCNSVTITRPETVLLARYSNSDEATFSRLAVTVDRRRRVILHWLSYAAGSDSQTLTGHSVEFPTQKEVSTALVQSVFSRREASVAAKGEVAHLKILPRILNVSAIANEAPRWENVKLVFHQPLHLGDVTDKTEDDVDEAEDVFHHNMIVASRHRRAISAGAIPAVYLLIMIYYPAPQLHGSQGSPIKDTMSSSPLLPRTAGLDRLLQSPMKLLSGRTVSTGCSPFQGTWHPRGRVTVTVTEGMTVERKGSAWTEDRPSPLASSVSLSSSVADTARNRRQPTKSSERFEKLYDDHRNRQERLIALVRAKQACEDAELAQMRRATAGPSKTLDLSRFRAELDEQLRLRERRRRRREEEKRRAARNREAAEVRY